MATKKAKTTKPTEATPMQQLADAAENAYAALTPKERELFHARFSAGAAAIGMSSVTEAQQVEIVNSLTLAVMASTGCDETTALARIKHAEQQVLKERELAAAAPQS